MDKQRYEAAQKLLAAAYEFWNACQSEGQYGAVQWLTDSDGRMIIFTRGEYRQQLMENIDTLPSQVGKIHLFGEALPDTDEDLSTGPDARGGSTELTCFFMADRHAFTRVAGDREAVTDQLIELHRRDAWHGIHGNWSGHPMIPSCQINPLDTPEENMRKIRDSVATAFAAVLAKGT